MLRTLFEKVWDEHVVATPSGQPSLLYVDLHLVHEVTSPQAFDGLRTVGRKVREPLRTIATVDHNVPTEPRGTPIFDPIAKRQIEALQQNCNEFGVRLCDMDIDAGARAGMVAPDDTTFAYIKGRRFAPAGAHWEAAVARWRTLPSDHGAKYDMVIEINASELAPSVTWGTNPGMVVPITSSVPELPANGSDRSTAQRMLEYMGLEPGIRMEQI